MLKSLYFIITNQDNHFVVITKQSKLKEVISYGKTELHAQFIELRHITTKHTTINLRDGRGNAIHGFDAGTAIRVLVAGSWDFVSIQTLTDIIYYFLFLKKTPILLITYKKYLVKLAFYN